MGTVGPAPPGQMNSDLQTTSRKTAGSFSFGVGAHVQDEFALDAREVPVAPTTLTVPRKAQ